MEYYLVWFHGITVHHIDTTEPQASCAIKGKLLPWSKDGTFTNYLHPMPDKEVLHLERVYYESKQMVKNTSQYNRFHKGPQQ